MKSFLSRFWRWYERYYVLNTGIAAGLFLLQIIHLVWLSLHVVSLRLFDHSFFDIEGVLYWLILIVDYTEIPAIITTSLVYINELRKQFSWKNFLYLIFLNTQWLHIFWITDEFVLKTLQGKFMLLPLWLVWAAIFIDYLELPVIADTVKKFYFALKERRIVNFVREDL